jgi:hypothetical protein
LTLAFCFKFKRSLNLAQNGTVYDELNKIMSQHILENHREIIIKKFGENYFNDNVDNLRWVDKFELLKLRVAKVKKTLLDGEFKDFEDSIQYNCAKCVTKIECIVTRDTKDFKLSSIPTMTPKEALTIIESTSH